MTAALWMQDEHDGPDFVGAGRGREMYRGPQPTVHNPETAARSPLSSFHFCADRLDEEHAVQRVFSILPTIEYDLGTN